LEAIAPSGRMWQGTESRCSSKQAPTVCPARGSGGLLASRRQRNGNRWRTASQTPLSGSQAQMMRSRGPEKEFLDLCTETLHASVSSSLSWKQHRSSLDTKSHRAPHEAYEARANAHLWTPPAGLAYTFLTPSLPGHPSARDAAKKKSYAHAVSRSFAYETRRHHPGSVLRRAVSCEHHHHCGSSRRTPDHLPRFLLLPSTTHPTERYNKGYSTALAPLPPTFHLHSRADPPVRDRKFATLSKAESTTCGVSSA
jgi:hypothetical protein